MHSTDVMKTVLAATLISVATASHAAAEWYRCAGSVQFPGDYASCTLGDKSGAFPNGPYVRIDYISNTLEPPSCVIQLTMCPYDLDEYECLDYRGPHNCRLTTPYPASESFSGGSWMITLNERPPYVWVDCDTTGWVFPYSTATRTNSHE